MEADAYQEDENEMEQDEESDDSEDDQDVVYEGSDTMSSEKEEAYFRDAKDFAGDIFLSLFIQVNMRFACPKSISSIRLTVLFKVVPGPTIQTSRGRADLGLPIQS